MSLGFVIDGGVDALAQKDEADGYNMRASVAANRREVTDRCRRDEAAHHLHVHVCTLIAVRAGWDDDKGHQGGQ